MRAAFFIALAVFSASLAAGPTLELQAKIPLSGCKGRIDHLAFDPVRRRLFVAELDNASVAIVDVDQHRLERRIAGLSEPQGIAYYGALQRLYVAEGGDGMVRAYDALDYRQINETKLTGDADNVRIDAHAQRLYVGYGDGSLAVLNPESLEKMGDIRLKAHPESFQLSASAGRIYVNVPDANEIAVVEPAAGKQIASFAAKWSANYPMAVDEDNRAVLSVFRKPARIARYASHDGSLLQQAESCADADDVFVDAKRKRVYVICGEGAVDVLDHATLERIDRLQTAPGARTGLYSLEVDLLFVAVRAHAGNEAAVWVLKPIH